MQLTPNLLPESWAWQEKELTEHPEPRRAIFASPRLGKTLVAVKWLRSLAENGTERLLISAPLRVCSLWAKTLEEAGIPVIAGFGKPTARVRALVKDGWSGALVLNIDKLDALRDVLVGRTQAFVCDEVHETSSPSSARGRAARAIGWKAQYFRGLTGTPVPNHNGNLWSSLTLSGGYTGSWTAFMKRYTIRDRFFPSKVVGHVNTRELHDRVRACASIIRREDVFGPDTYQIIERPVELPPAVRATYQKLASAWIIEAPVLLVADHTLSRLIRLQQITSGFLPNGEDAEGPHVWLHTEKIDAVLADLDEIVVSGEKAVVFHRFRPEGHALEAALQAAKVPTFVINGSRTAEQSEAERAAFSAYDGGAVIVVQVQSGGVGISLAEASHALYLSRTFSFVQDEQSRDRIYKPGARRTVTYYNVPKTIDVFIARTLAKKHAIHDALRTAKAASVVFGEDL